MTLRAVVFDVDGVLVHAGVFGDILEARYGLDRDKTRDFFGGPFRECVQGRADMKEAVAPFLPRWGFPGTLDDFVALWFESDSETNEPMLEVAANLRAAGVPCFVASTQEAHRAAYLESVVGLAGRFDGFFFSCRVGHTKGDVRFFESVTPQIGVEPAEILFFDDVDGIVQTARSAGWNAEVYAFGHDVAGVLESYGL